MEKKENLILQKATWKKAVLLTVLFVAFYLFINYSGAGVGGLLKLSGGTSTLDFEFGFTQEKAYQMLTVMGPAGRAFYLAPLVPLDFPFPFVYMLCFASWIALLLKNMRSSNRYSFLLLIPVLAMLCDWIENVGIIAMLGAYPNLPAWAARLASVAGMLKFGFLLANIIVMVLLFVVLLIKKIRK